MATHSALPLNLRQLQHAVLLAEDLHFGRAAERAFLSQSAFSRSIAALEDAVGLRLFDRGPGFVRLTPAGDRVVGRARRMLSSSSDLSRELALLRSGDLGDMTVGAGPYSGTSLVAGAIARLHQDHPEVRVRLEIAQPLVLLHQLLAEQLDFFICDLSELPAHEQCEIEPLGAALGVLFARAEHPLAAGQALGLSDLRGQRFASVHVPTPLSRRLGELFGTDEAGLLPLTLECESAMVLREYMLQHDVLVSAPPQAFALEESAGRLKRLNVPELDALGAATPLRMDLGLVWLRERTPSPATALLAGLLRADAKASLIGGGVQPAAPRRRRTRQVAR